MAQHESISRKVIAGVITAVIVTVLGFLAKWLLPGLGTFFLTIWRWCVHLVSVPASLLIVLSLYVGTSLIRAYLRHRRRTRQNTQHADEFADEPDWPDYTCDHCGNQVLLDGSHDEVIDRVSRQIQRKLRSPGKEWKTAIKIHGWRNK